MMLLTEKELSGQAYGLSFRDLSWLQRERKRIAAEIDEQMEREGEALLTSSSLKRPKRKKAKVPGWQRFKVAYHIK